MHEVTIENFVIADFVGYAFKIEDDTRANFSNSLTIGNTILFNNDGFASAADSTDYGAVTTEVNPSFANVAGFDFTVAQPIDGATPPSGDGFFNTSATHIGAFGATNWAVGNWVRLTDN